MEGKGGWGDFAEWNGGERRGEKKETVEKKADKRQDKRRRQKKKKRPTLDDCNQGGDLFSKQQTCSLFLLGKKVKKMKISKKFKKFQRTTTSFEFDTLSNPSP